MRGFWTFLKILGHRERTKEDKCKMLLILRYFPVLFAHMLDAYLPLFSNLFEMLGFGILVRFSWMFPDVLYKCSNALP